MKKIALSSRGVWCIETTVLNFIGYIFLQIEMVIWNGMT